MANERAQRVSIANDPRARALLYQGALAAALIGLAYLAWRNAVANMQARGVPMGFGFWDETAGFDVNQALIPFSALSTYGRAFWVGLLNTLLVGAVSIVLATPLGFAVGLARLAPNWLLSRIALVYVELTRNTPLLLQLFFWYNAVLKTLPSPRQSLSLAGVFFLNNRGLYLPRPIFYDGAWLVGAALALAAALMVAVAVRGVGAAWRPARSPPTSGPRWGWSSVCRLSPISPPASRSASNSRSFPASTCAAGRRSIPSSPRSPSASSPTPPDSSPRSCAPACMAVPRGQSEAAAALGLHRPLALRLVVVPQALRLITPPLTSQYLNIIKNSSLAVFVGYPDLVLVFAGTVLNQTHAAMQVMAVTMAVYLAISLVVSFALNLFDARNALKER